MSPPHLGRDRSHRRWRRNAARHVREPQTSRLYSELGRPVGTGSRWARPGIRKRRSGHPSSAPCRIGRRRRGVGGTPQGPGLPPAPGPTISCGTAGPFAASGDGTSMERDTQSVLGTTWSQSHDRPPRRFQPGRVCAFPDCGTRLSIYNEDMYCTLHVKNHIRFRGKKVVQSEGSRGFRARKPRRLRPPITRLGVAAGRIATPIWDVSSFGGQPTFRKPQPVFLAQRASLGLETRPHCSPSAMH